MKKFEIKWSKDEDEYLINNYSNNGNEYCRKFLINRTGYSIAHRAKKLNLKLTDVARSTILNKYKKEDIEQAVNNSYCIADVCRYFNLLPQANNYGNFRKLINFYSINTNHFLSVSELNKLKNRFNNGFIKKELSTYLIENSNIDRGNLKKRLYDEGLKERKCELCGQGEEWHGKHISLILDHINGINNDNRLENLQIVCPNCNAGLDTHCSKNRKIMSNNIETYNQIGSNRKQIPTKIKILMDFNELKTFVAVGKKYNVSDNAVRKWCKKYGIFEEIKNKKVFVY